MSLSTIPLDVLSERLGAAIGGRRVRTAVFTTFTFDPGFFELHVLPTLFDYPFSQVDKVKRIQLDDQIRSLDEIAVYYDRTGLSQDALPAQLDFRRIDVRRKNGIFHPKAVLLLVENVPDDEDEDDDNPWRPLSLIIGALSANLTRSGWWENVETGHFAEIADREWDPKPCSFRKDVLALIRRIREAGPATEEHAALDRVHAFLRDRASTESPARRSTRGKYHPRLFVGQSSLPEWLRDLKLDQYEWNLEIISPYFDKADAGTVEALVDVLDPKETRIFLPVDAEGCAEVSRPLHDAVGALARWSRLPVNVTHAGKKAAADRAVARRVHAKVYRLWSRHAGEIVLTGSVNLTAPAHSHGRAGNLEAAFLVDRTEDAGAPRWWLEPLEKTPGEFTDEPHGEAEESQPVPIDVTFRYDWTHETLACRSDAPISGRLTVNDPSGRALFEVEPGPGEWFDCGPDAARAVAALLPSTSFLELRHGDLRWRVLVREEGMSQRPSLLSSLTPEEILMYWSLLSPAQQAAFIDAKTETGDGDLKRPTGGGFGTEDTVFDRFAGVYHAFEQLRRQVVDALDKGRERDAAARLLGAKYDSLPELLRKVLERTSGDPVMNYVQFLCARQLLDHVETGWPDFIADRDLEAARLRELLEGAHALRASLPLGDDPERDAFLDWYESMYLAPAVAPGVAGVSGGDAVKTISLEFARALLDFAPSDETKRMGFGESQLHGAVAAYNMLARNRVAYLADEVGMGKTYVALGVLGLMRHLDPRTRAMIIAPRENIQRKWEKELQNFVRFNWRIEDNCVKDLQAGPVRTPLVCANMEELLRAVRINDHRDMLMRMPSFSSSVANRDARKRWRERLRPNLPWIDKSVLSSADESIFRDNLGRVLNAVIPPLDLLIIDEAHNLKHGFGPKASNRNRLLGLAMGHPSGNDGACDWYGPRPKHVLLLSATPFEYEYADLYNQLDVLGLAGRSLVDADGGAPLPLSLLRDRDASDEEKARVARRIMIRRVAYLNIAGRRFSKNMYRREWRKGGLAIHDEPMAIDDVKERLVVGLMQKKVAEILGDKRFNNSFQIGMLSSFESFLETMAHRRARAKKIADAAADSEDGETEPTFDGEQNADVLEKQGIDTATIESVVRSYRDRFGRSLPHPKLDATARSLEGAFESGEKALVFVRRVATVDELRRKLDDAYDVSIRRRMEALLPELHGEIARIFDAYARDRNAGEPDRETDDSAHADIDDPEEELVHPLEDDEGGTDSFFAWFFRGEGPKGFLSGAAFQKNRLTSMNSRYSTVFEDDYVGWLLDRPDDVLGSLVAHVGRPHDDVVTELSERAYAHMRGRSRQTRSTRFYVFEGYQVAGLRLLRDAGGEIGERAEQVLRLRYGATGDSRRKPSSGFAGPTEFLGLTSFFSELRKDDALRDALWPDDPSLPFTARFRRREQRRELLSAMARLGSAYVDLYCLGIRALGSFEPGAAIDRADEILARDFVALLREQMNQDGFHAYRELSEAARTFDLLHAVNFPEARDAELTSLPEIYARTLQHQVPVGGMTGGNMNKRMIRQFRMPGYPLVLVTTDVLQEGEDLHTYCRRVIHYGITWTPSAMEQRTGRIDRIGGLVQRELDGCETEPDHRELIQVHLPHLQETVEVLQVRRVLQRLNRFIEMVHKRPSGDKTVDSRVNVARDVLQAVKDVPRITRLLESDFPVDGPWLKGDVGVASVKRPDIAALETYLESLWQRLVRNMAIRPSPTESPRRRSGFITRGGGAEVAFDLLLRSQECGDATLLRCVARLDAHSLDDEGVDLLYEAQRRLGIAKVCARHDAKTNQYAMSVEGDRLFHLRTTQPEEVEELVQRTTCAVATIRDAIGRGANDDTSRRERGPEGDDRPLRALAREVHAAHSTEWTYDAGGLTVRIGEGKRHQDIRLAVEGEDAVVSTTVLGTKAVTRTDRGWRELARLAWQRNAGQEIVTFGFDEDDRLVGIARHPMAHLDAAELELYIQIVSRECDRFEYLLSGADLF